MTRRSRHRKSRPSPATSSSVQCKARGPCLVASPRRGAANSRSRCRSSSKPATNSYMRSTPIPVTHQAPTTTTPATRRRKPSGAVGCPDVQCQRDRGAPRRLEVLVLAETGAQREMPQGATFAY